jgi:hypothetical protein
MKTITPSQPIRAVCDGEEVAVTKAHLLTGGLLVTEYHSVSDYEDSLHWSLPALDEVEDRLRMEFAS